jgi:TetR/AcrR family transcriptional regulator, copper-responsive repressor
MKYSDKRPPGRPRSFSLEAALDHAIPIFWEKGYEGASFRDLTSAMGISAPSLVAAFGDKRALFNAAVERYGQTVAARHLAAFEGVEGLRDQLSAFFAAVIATAAGDGKPKGCLVTCALADAAGDDDAARAQLATLIAGADEALTRQFVSAGFTPAEAHGRAQIAAATMHSIALRARAGAGEVELVEIRDAAVSLLAGQGNPQTRQGPSDPGLTARGAARSQGI